jgi:universal stress protein A
MKTILAPIDFSTATDAVLTAALELARAVSGRIVLLHVVQPPILTSDYGLALENFQEAIAISEEHSKKRLAEISQRLRSLGASIESEQVSGPPTPEIVSCAQRVRADYIIMGSHGHTAIYDLIVGTTTHGVLRKATCPVVIVPPKGQKA